MFVTYVAGNMIQNWVILITVLNLVRLLRTFQKILYALCVQPIRANSLRHKQNVKVWRLWAVSQQSFAPVFQEP